MTYSKRDGSIIDLILGILHFLDKKIPVHVYGILPRPSPRLAGTVHFGMTQTLFRDYWQRYSINRRISKDTQINFWPVLFESNEKMKYIHKNSDPPT